MSEKKDPMEDLLDKARGFARWLADDNTFDVERKPHTDVSGEPQPAAGPSRVRPAWDTWATGFTAGHTAGLAQAAQAAETTPDPPAPAKTDARPGTPDVSDEELVALRFLLHATSSDGWTIIDIPDLLLPLLTEEWNTWEKDPGDVNPYQAEWSYRGGQKGDV